MIHTMNFVSDFDKEEHVDTLDVSEIQLVVVDDSFTLETQRGEETKEEIFITKKLK